MQDQLIVHVTDKQKSARRYYSFATIPVPLHELVAVTSIAPREDWRLASLLNTP